MLKLLKLHPTFDFFQNRDWIFKRSLARSPFFWKTLALSASSTSFATLAFGLRILCYFDEVFDLIRGLILSIITITLVQELPPCKTRCKFILHILLFFSELDMFGYIIKLLKIYSGRILI